MFHLNNYLFEKVHFFKRILDKDYSFFLSSRLQFGGGETIDKG